MIWDTDEIPASLGEWGIKASGQLGVSEERAIMCLACSPAKKNGCESHQDFMLLDSGHHLSPGIRR